VIVIAGLTVSGWIDSAVSWSKVRRAESRAETAERDRDEALRNAARIAADIRAREEALKQVEAKRDEKQIEADKAHRNTLDARAEYDRAVREQRPDTPGTDELCAELAALGYPCK
jgi:hypothetical protein